MAICVFDLFKVGIGPSSSRTVGPMQASCRFAEALATQRVQRVTIDLYGSLGATGRGHGTDKAVMLGLAGHAPDTVDVNAVPEYLATIREGRTLILLGRHALEPIHMLTAEERSRHRNVPYLSRESPAVL